MWQPGLEQAQGLVEKMQMAIENAKKRLVEGVEKKDAMNVKEMAQLEQQITVLT